MAFVVGPYYSNFVAPLDLWGLFGVRPGMFWGR